MSQVTCFAVKSGFNMVQCAQMKKMVPQYADGMSTNGQMKRLQGLYSFHLSLFLSIFF